MTLLWINGWAIPIQYTKKLIETAFPEFQHTILHPSKDSIPILKSSNYDAVIGYSLGATLLLQEALNINHYCLAPFLNIKDATSVHESQLKLLLRQLKSNPLKAIKDFYTRAQLDIKEIKDLPYPLEDLFWGIETLLNTRHKLIDFLQNPRILPFSKEKFFEGPECIRKYMRIPNKFLTMLQGKRLGYARSLIHNPNRFILLGQNDPLIKSLFFQQNFYKLKILKKTNHNLKSYLNYLTF